jgi:hypothetical protein
MAPFGPDEAPPLLKWVLVLTDLAVAETFWQFFLALPVFCNS